MPRLGEPIEPVQADAVVPWWRDVDTVARKVVPEETEATALPKAMPWPID